MTLKWPCKVKMLSIGPFPNEDNYFTQSMITPEFKILFECKLVNNFHAFYRLVSHASSISSRKVCQMLSKRRTAVFGCIWEALIHFNTIDASFTNFNIDQPIITTYKYMDCPSNFRVHKNPDRTLCSISWRMQHKSSRPSINNRCRLYVGEGLVLFIKIVSRRLSAFQQCLKLDSRYHRKRKVWGFVINMDRFVITT